jgi:hypothetical protein
VLPWECRTLRIIKNTSDCRPNQDVTTTLNHELVILSLIPILWLQPTELVGTYREVGKLKDSWP